jgi:hypothetical protein
MIRLYPFLSSRYFLLLNCRGRYPPWLTITQLWTTNSGGWDQRGAHLQCVVCRHGKPNIPQDPYSNPASNILILLITREDIANNAPSAYKILSDLELSGHKSVTGPHTRFTHFHVPAANVLCAPGPGAQVVEKTFGTSAAIVGAMSVGIMRHAFDAALSFCKTDARGGTELTIEHQSVADRLIDAKMVIEAARALMWKAMSVLESAEESITWQQRLEIALEAKIWCSEQAPKVVLGCMSVVGMYVSPIPFLSSPICPCPGLHIRCINTEKELTKTRVANLTQQTCRSRNCYKMRVVFRCLMEAM